MRLVTSLAILTILLGSVAVAFAEEVQPIAMSIKAIGGADLNQYTTGVEKGSGANNIGLLIRTWGKVTKLDTNLKFFYIDDGSNRLDESGFVGVRVSYNNLPDGVTINPPAEQTYVLVTCISSTIMINDKVQPNLLPRRDSDIQKFIL